MIERACVLILMSVPVISTPYGRAACSVAGVGTIIGALTLRFFQRWNKVTRPNKSASHHDDAHVEVVVHVETSQKEMQSQL